MLSDKNWQKGYRHAQEDFKNGKGNNLAKRSVNRLFPWVEPGSYAPGAENRDDNYRAGYTTGHTDAVRTINVLPVEISSFSTVTTGASMSNIQSLAHQIELLEDMKKHIELLQYQMDSMMQQYRAKVQNMYEAGMTTERYDRLQRDVFEPTNVGMKQFVDHLQLNDLRVVNNTLEKVMGDLAYEQGGSR